MSDLKKPHADISRSVRDAFHLAKNWWSQFRRVSFGTLGWWGDTQRTTRYSWENEAAGFYAQCWAKSFQRFQLHIYNFLIFKIRRWNVATRRYISSFFFSGSDSAQVRACCWWFPTCTRSLVNYCHASKAQSHRRSWTMAPCVCPASKPWISRWCTWLHVHLLDKLCRSLGITKMSWPVVPPVGAWGGGPTLVVSSFFRSG